MPNLSSDRLRSTIEPHVSRAGGHVKRRSFAPALGFFALFMLACSDVLSMPLAGGNFRVFYLAAFFPLALYWQRLSVDPSFALRVFVLFVSLAPNVVLSIDRSRSVLYIVWIALTLVCTLGTFPRLVRFDPVKGPMIGSFELYDLLLQIFRFQIIAGIALVAIGSHERTRFLYYEPSYFSLSLAIYCAIVAHRIRQRRRFMVDATLGGAYLLTSQSGAFAVVLLVTAVLNLTGVRWRYLGVATVVLLASAVAYVMLVDDPTTTVIKLFVSGEIDLYGFLLRGGNRLGRIIAAWDVFNDHPGVGIGLGAFETATRSLDLDAPDEREYLRAEGMPAINIYLELLATTGIVGFAGFALLLWPLMRWILGPGFASPLSRGVVCMLLVLNWESNFLRPYLWAALALCSAEMSHARTGALRARAR